MKTNKLILLLFVVFAGISCSDEFFNVETTQNTTAEAAAKAADEDPSKIASFIDAIYNVLVQYDLYSTSHDAFGYMAILHATDMMSEDIVMTPLHWFNFDYLHSNREWDYRRTNVIWRYFYTAISSANNVLGMTSAESTSKDVLVLRGQALALRAFSYFYLVQLYQHVYPVVNSGTDLPGVPLYYANNEEQESITARASVQTILAQIEEDLTTAVANLEGWSRSSKNQVDYNVANGLLARYCLLTQQWSNAIAAAQKARTGYPIMSATGIYDGFFNINNTEWLWGFDHNAETTTLYASFFSHISNLTGGYAGLNYAARLVDKRLYENIPASDARKEWFQNATASLTPRTTPASAAISWKLPYAALKFGYDGAFAQDYLYMRASELVLIEAEALAHLGRGGEAATLLRTELLSKRDPSWNQSSVTVDDVHLQRRIELWGEGFATFDLKRLNKGIDRTYSGTNHYASAQFKIDAGDKRWIYRIPQSEIQENADISEDDNNE
ncbi:MAG: RagB/SusD family nutrient uptake outer membrane protein [Prevotellaceae bacterium]|nr:RagB/SusD family nutrient uptake outer membrane protein [Prevotellaceae bacterium]